MKKFINIRTTLLVAALLAFVACSDDDDDLIAGPLATGNGYYFDGTASSSIALSTAEVAFSVPVYRSEKDGAATVNISSTVTLTTTDAGGAVVDADASSLFDIPSSVSFADGQTEADFTIGYDPDVINYDTYNFTLSVEGSGETTPYGVATYSFSAGLEQPWISLGIGTYIDDFMTTFYGVDNLPESVEIQENGVIPGMYRVVYPYGEAYPYNEAYDDGTADWDLTQTHYMIIHAEDPEGVYIEQHDSGMDWGYGDILMWCLANYYMELGGYSLAEVKAAGYCGTLVDGVISFPEQTLLIQMPLYAADAWYYANYNGAFKVILPGYSYVETDYSVGVSYKGTYTDTGDNVYAIGSFTLGADVAYAEVAMLAGNDASSMLNGMLAGTVETQVITSDCNLTFPLEDSGQYTIMIVSYDENGEAMEYNYVIFNYYASSSENPWTSLGYAEYTDDCVTSFFYMYEEGDLAVPYDVEIQESNTQPGLYRLVNPYGEAYPFNDPGDWDTSQDYYLEINACDPEGVYFDAFDTGMDWGYGNFGIWSLASYYMAYGYSLEEEKAYGDCGTLVDGVITFPVEGLLVSMANYQGGNWYYANYWGNHKIVLPSARDAKGKKSKSVVNTSGTKHFRAPAVKTAFAKAGAMVPADVKKGAMKEVSGFNTRLEKLLRKK